MSVVYLDIETYCEPTDEIKALVRGGLEPRMDWGEEAREKDLVKRTDAAVDKLALDPKYGQIVTLCYAIDDGPVDVLALGPGRNTEEMVIDYFFKRIQPQGSEWPRLAVFNGEFDLGYLYRRALILGIKPPMWLPKPSVPPWRWNNVIDPYYEWGARKGKQSELCWAFNIDTSANSIDGSQVGELWAKGEYETVINHCRQDVIELRELCKRMRLV